MRKKRGEREWAWVWRLTLSVGQPLGRAEVKDGAVPTISFRLLFKFALKFFYGSIAVENADIPPESVLTELH